MAMVVLTFGIMIAGAVAFDWISFSRTIGGLPPTAGTGTAYRDYFFPRVIFIVLAGALVAYGVGAHAEPDRALFIGGGTALFLIAHCIQYYWLFTD